MLGDMNQSLGSGWRGTEARHHATRKGFEHAPIFKSFSEGPVAKKNHPAFVEFLLSEGKLVLWVTIQQKSASLYNFSTKVNIYLPSRPK